MILSFLSFRDVFDSKIEEQRALSQENQERELQELRERSETIVSMHNYNLKI